MATRRSGPWVMSPPGPLRAGATLGCDRHRCADGPPGTGSPAVSGASSRVLRHQGLSGGKAPRGRSVEYIEHRGAVDAERLREGERGSPVPAVDPAVRGPAPGVAAGVLPAASRGGNGSMRTGAARGYVGNFHEAGFYSSDAEFLALIVPFVTGGMASSEPVVIGYDARKCDLLRATLPRSDAVTYIVDQSLYASPARAIEAYRQQFERHLAAGAEQIRIAGDVPHEGNGGRFDGWDRYESAVNVVWQDYPVWSRCLYDASTVPDDVRDVVQRTHRRLVMPDGAASASPRFEEVTEFTALPPASDPLEAAAPTVELINPSAKRTRRRVQEVAHGRIGAAALDE